MRILSIDYQKDFSASGGRWFKPRPCVEFLHEVLIPVLRASHMQVAEIVSDYRLPRPSETEAYCVPGTWGFESEIPPDVRYPEQWIKAMNSPSWTRDGAGDSSRDPGFPYCAPAAFDMWLRRSIGEPNSCGEVVLAGLTLDCCVLSTAQELYFRGYKVCYLIEAVDTYNGLEEEKALLFKTPLSMWGTPISWYQVSQSMKTEYFLGHPGPDTAENP